MRNFEIMTETQYKEYMRHYNAAANAFDKVLTSANDVDSVKLDFMRNKHAIETDKNITEAYRTERIADLHKNAVQRLASIWSVVENILPSLSEELETIAEGIDLNDPRFTAAVALATTPGASAATLKAQKALVEPFIGNEDALNMLRSVAQKAGMEIAVGMIEDELRVIEKAKAFVDEAATLIRRGTYTPEGDFVWFNLAPYSEAVAKMHSFTIPEKAEGLMEAAARISMGLPVV